MIQWQNFEIHQHKDKKFCLSSSGISIRDIAANCILVINIAPKRAELSSPIAPF